MILGVSWSFAIVCTALAVLRTFSAASKKDPISRWDLRWDYIWFVVSYLIAIPMQIFLTLSVLYGLGNHTKQVAFEDAATASLYNWTFEMIAIIDIGFAKIAIIAFILMLQGPTHPKMKWVLHFIWISNFLVNINQIVLITFQCKPMSAFWDTRIENPDCTLRPTVSKIGFMQGGWGAATDFALAIYPVFIYWKLQMSWRLKLGLFALTGGGMVVGAAAILKTMYIAVITVTDDIMYAFADLVIWLNVELWLVLILSSIPPLRPLFISMYRKTTTVVSSKNMSSGTHQQPGTSAEDGMPLNSLSMYPRDIGYKTQVGSSGEGVARRDPDDYEDNESQEDILPQKNHGEIWITRDTTVHSGRMKSLGSLKD